MLLHPDKAPPEHKQAAETQFRNLQRAFEVLLDPERRAVYDALGEDGLRSEWRVGRKGKSPEQVSTPVIRSGRLGLTHTYEFLRFACLAPRRLCYFCHTAVRTSCRPRFYAGFERVYMRNRHKRDFAKISVSTRGGNFRAS